MTELRTLRQWMEALGLQVSTGTGASAPEELWVTPPHDAEPRLVIRAGEPGTFEIVFERRVSASNLDAEWRAPWDTDPPAATLSQAARQLAGGYPLVEADTSPDGDDVVVRLRAPVLADGLTGQGLGLTVSSVLKAAQSLQLLIAGRAGQLAAWTDYQGSLDQHRQEQRALVDQMKSGPPPADATVPVAAASAASPGAAAWAPTHTLRRPAPAWAQPDAALAAVATIEQRTQVQVLERYGDWTRVLCSNGWSGWIDGRDLKAR
jgi:Bacterial SH3 domain